MKKFLCVCEGGNVRSVSMAFALKEQGQDALAIGWRFISPGTLNMLCKWADYIIVMQPMFTIHIPPEFQVKVRTYDVGEDNYGNPFHDQLLRWTRHGAAQYRKLNFEL